MKNSFYISHTGCDSAEYDSNKICYQLQSDLGLTSTNRENADIIIILGCTFTQQKEEEFKNDIENTINFVKAELIIVSGCYLSKSVINKKVVYAKKENIIKVIRDYLHIYSKNVPKKTNLANSQSPIIAISEGCYGDCSFCSVKKVRGHHQSRRVSDILSDTENALISHDTIRFVGQDIAAYGRDQEITLGDLLRETFKAFPAIKLELGSLNPQWLAKLNMDNLSLLNSPNIIGNIHIPLQSASERVLKRMNRGYTYEEYLSLWLKLKDDIGVDNLSTDIISGFPGESEKDHLETLEFLRSNKLSFIQIFMYDPRPGTIAANYSQLPREIRLKRTLDLIAEYVASFLRFHSIENVFDTTFSVPFNSNVKIDKENISNESCTIFS